jgi:hypothetical protein
MNSNNVEIPNSYTLEYSTDSTFQTGVSSKSFPATGGNNSGFAGSMGVNGQQGGNSPWVVTGLTNSDTYYFRAAGVVGSGSSAVTGPWSVPSPGIVINAPANGNLVKGAVTFNPPSGGSITGPLYVGYWNQNTGGIYAEEITNPVSPQAYSVSVPGGSNYFFFAFIDQNNDGMIDPGDITNTFNNNMITPSVDVAGALSNQNLTLSSANSSAMIITANYDSANESGTTSTQSYGISLTVSTVNKLPVSVELLSGSNVLAPMDISVSTSNGPDGASGGYDRFNAGNIQLNSALAPTVGNAYGVKVIYSDGTSETLNPQVTAVLPLMPALDLSPIGPVTASNASTLKPTFNWQYPASPGNYLYQLWVADERNYATTWSIPSVYSASNGFNSSVSSISWGADPTGVTNNTPTISSMVSGDTYYWEIVAYDANGNRSQASGNYTPGYTVLALPAANPSSLGSATLGQTYSGSIAASGGYLVYGGGYSGFSVNCSGCWGNPSVSLGNGLTANGSWGQNSLTITGTPTATGLVSFTVYVQDNSGATVGPVTYTINVTAADGLSLPAPNPSSLGPTVVGLSYFGSISAMGGVGPYTWHVNNLSDNLNWHYTGSEYDSIILGGTPNNTGTVTFNVTVTDHTGASYGPVAYTIAVNAAVAGTYEVSGYVGFNGCGSGNEPPVTLTLSGGGITQTTASDSNGIYQFSSVPSGSYTITPSITGPSSSSFSPASQPVTVASTYVNNNNFNATVGYTVSGTVNYSGADTGQIYLSLSGCGSTAPGTSLSAPGTFTIHGVPPGEYTLNAWIDNKSIVSGEQLGGYGVLNASNPTGSTSNVLVPNDNITNLTVGMTDPSAVTLSSSPTWTGQASGAFSGGAIVSFTPIRNSSNEEIPNSYTLEYSTDSTFTTGVSSKSFPATGGKNAGFAGSLGVGGLQGGNSPWVVTGLTNNDTYYFRAAGVIGSGSSAVTGPWSSPSPGLLIEASPASGNLVKGAVTFSAPSGGSITGPLYVGYWNQNTGGIYAEEITSPVSPQAYSVSVPTGSNYFFFAFIDQNNDGMIDTGDITNAFNYNMVTPAVDVAGALTNQNLTLSNANSSAVIITGHNDGAGYSGTSATESYEINLLVKAVNKLPVSVELLSGSNILAPMDIAVCPRCGYDPNSQFWGNLLQLNSSLAPTVGNTYPVKVIYSDGTSETLNPQVTAVLPMMPALDLSPIGPVTTSNASTLKPTFNWQYPASPGNYLYQLWVADERTWTTTWSIPNVYSASNSFTSSVSSIPWGTDPTGVINNTPTISNMVNGDTYGWEIVAYDANGNRSQASGSYTPGYTALALPAANPSSLGSATIGQLYSGSIAASGGYLDFGGGYSGFSINCSSCFGNNAVSLGNGLTANGSWGLDSLTITGTPNATGPVTFSVYVEDASGAVVGPVTYTINISEAPVTLNGSTPQTAFVSQFFSQTISASGGSDTGYGFSVGVNGGASNPVTGTLALADGLSAAVNGNQLVISGTPSTAATITLSVYVQDGQGNNTTQTFTINAVSPPNGANNQYLSGTYVCKTDGFLDSGGSRWTSLVSFKANGATGTIINGIWDTNGRATGAMSGTLTGNYSIGSDNNGLMTLNPVWITGGSGTSTSQFAIALNNNSPLATATEFRLVEVDTNGQHGSGVCYKANTAAFGMDVFAGNSFVYMMPGEDGSGNPDATLGRFVTSGGSVTGGVADYAAVTDTSETESSFTGGSYTVPDATNGRAKMTVSMSSGTGTSTKTYTGTSEVYVIDANRMFMINISDQQASSGDVRKQQQATYSGANLSGPFVLYDQNLNGTIGSFDYGSWLGQGSGDGAGNITFGHSYNDDWGNYVVNKEIGGPIAVSFDSSNPGRATLSYGGSGSPFLYFFDNNSALFLDFDGSASDLEWGWMEPQTQTLFANATLGGDYLIGPMPMMSASQSAQIGEADLNRTYSSAYTGELTTGGAGVFSFDQPFSGMTYAWDTTATGTGTFLIPSAGMSCAVINSTKAVCTNQTGFPSINILQQ